MARFGMSRHRSQGTPRLPKARRQCNFLLSEPVAVAMTKLRMETDGYVPTATEVVMRSLEEFLVVRGYLQPEEAEWPLERLSTEANVGANDTPTPCLCHAGHSADAAMTAFAEKLAADTTPEVSALEAMVVQMMIRQWGELYEAMESAGPEVTEAVGLLLRKAMLSQRIPGLVGDRCTQRYAVEGMRAMMAAWTDEVGD